MENGLNPWKNKHLEKVLIFLHSCTFYWDYHLEICKYYFHLIFFLENINHTFHSFIHRYPPNLSFSTDLSTLSTDLCTVFPWINLILFIFYLSLDFTVFLQSLHFLPFSSPTLSLSLPYIFNSF